MGRFKTDENSTGGIEDGLATIDEIGAILKTPNLVTTKFAKQVAQRAAAVKHAPTRKVLNRSAIMLNRLADWQMKKNAEDAMRPNVAVPICVDGLATVTESGVITVSAPYNGQPWTVCDFLVFSQGTGVASFRLSSFKIAGIDFVNSSGVAFASGAPTLPGLSLAMWAQDKYSRPENRFMPWAGYAFNPEGQLTLKVYNQGAATASVNILMLCRSSPCDQGWNKGMVAPQLQAKTMAKLGAFRIRHGY